MLHPARLFILFSLVGSAALQAAEARPNEIGRAHV